MGTGDLSEIALGWSTYNGDHMSMYAVNCSIPKTLIRCLIEHIAGESSPELAATLADINNTPVSPELLPPSGDGSIEQRTEDVLGPYDLHDFFLFHFIKYGAEPDKILYLAEHAFRGEFQPDFIRRCLGIFIRRFFRQQFKRSCMPDGPKVGTIALSPRGDWAHAFRRLRNSVGKRYFPPLNPSGGLLHADLLRRPGMNCPTGKLNARGPASTR